ncbi:MAG: nucleoside triphosphate pyrophosphohydrolase [Candidatus Melainabacteria bacterium]|nr:nucleoside triphosphate pyrophosphohydrolase [Candidatus Melainabacteria bacterium]
MPNSPSLIPPIATSPDEALALLQQQCSEHPNLAITLAHLSRLLAIVARLRHPTEGCPWDLKQTHHSLKPYLLEEAYETLEAIDRGRPTALCEELGDVFLQVLLHAQIAQDAQTFDMGAVSQHLAEKLIRRHPHVFSTEGATPENLAKDAEAVAQTWEAIKQAERAQSNGLIANGLATNGSATDKSPVNELSSNEPPPRVLKDVKRHQPALSRALETSQKAVAVGFEWPSFESLWACVMSEYDELQEALASQAPFEHLEEEMGDILFASVNLARHCRIHPEVALTRATDKFTRRFQAMERLAKQPLESLDFETWDHLWKQAKHQVAQTDAATQTTTRQVPVRAFTKDTT